MEDQEPNKEQTDTPIFSKEFLELNRSKNIFFYFPKSLNKFFMVLERESELRRLRIDSVRLEEEQVALENFISRLKKATEELEVDVVQQRGLTDKIRSQLDNYRRSLVQAFAHMPLPGKCFYFLLIKSFGWDSDGLPFLKGPLRSRYSLPLFLGTNIVPTLATIDTYMNNIHKLVLETPGEHQDFVAKVRDIVTKLKIPFTPL